MERGLAQRHKDTEQSYGVNFDVRCSYFAGSVGPDTREGLSVPLCLCASIYKMGRWWSILKDRPVRPVSAGKTFAMTSSARSLLPSLAFVIGMAAFGFIGRQALLASKKLDEFVTVKGLSEREVPANLAIWPVAFSVTDNDLTALQAQIQKARETVHGFLTEQGFKPEELSNSPPRIDDLASGNEEQKPAFRYRANLTVLLRSAKIAEVKAAMEASDKLVQRGIALTGGEYSSRAQFLFTGLNEIKPGMIQEANRAARKAAEQFANDSQAQVGTIRHAVQGPFEINDVDPSSPDRKIVRVVTTVDFYLQ